MTYFDLWPPTHLPDERQGDTIDDPQDATEAHRAEIQRQVKVIPRLLRPGRDESEERDGRGRDEGEGFEEEGHGGKVDPRSGRGSRKERGLMSGMLREKVCLARAGDLCE
jgi:hypothetical protein